MADDGAQEGILSIAQCFILAERHILHGYVLILKVILDIIIIGHHMHRIVRCITLTHVG